MNSKQLKTLKAIFERPTRSDLRWNDVVSLLRALGAEIEERSASRICVLLNDRVAVFHQPHPERICGRSLVRDIRDFLASANVMP